MTQIKWISTKNKLPKTTAILFAILLQGIFFCSMSQSIDTIQIKELQEVNITETAIKKELYSTTPLQILDSKKIERLNVTQLSDAVKFFSGVTVKDYGGVGGLKTVSMHGFGSTHTCVSYDGIPVLDGISGQIDLGRFSLSNVSTISLSAGQTDEIFQSARLFASAAVLKIHPTNPDVSKDKKVNIKARFKAGSFGLWNPLLNVEGFLGKYFSASVNAEYISSLGNYPYTLHYGVSVHDSTSEEKRKNSDVETWRATITLSGNIKKSKQFRMHCSYYQSERGLPGSTIFYYSHSTQRLWDKNFFTQLRYEQRCKRRFSFQVNGKYNHTYQRYLNPDFLGSGDAQGSNYYQNEGYGSATLLCFPVDSWSFSISNDLIYNDMRSDLPSFAYPERYTWLAVVAGKFSKPFISVTANILSAVVHEYVNYNEGMPASTNNKAPNNEGFSPAVSLAFRPFQKEELSLRMMYKEIFRMPSFNDMYYSRVGNPDLKPEYTWQYNIGATWGKRINEWMPQISLIADVYYNKVKNKIIAIPTKNIFEWLMQNTGKVDIYGFDFSFDTYFKLAKQYRFLVNATYSFQKAMDVTSKTDPVYSKVYKHQIPYTPEHSGGGVFTFENPYLNFYYSIIYSGSRYTLGQNIPENHLKSYSDQSISLGKQIIWGAVSLSGKFEIFNLFDKQYEVVRYFPMQGRFYQITLGMKW